MSPVARGAAAGLVLGVVARAAMRGVALLAGDEPAFEAGATGAILGLFVLAGAGSALAGVLASRSVLLALLVGILACGPLLLLGAGIGTGEISETALGVRPGVARASALALSAAIVATVVLTPYVGWRGRRARTAG